ncbi:MAG: MFS transporter [Propionibacteriaceae bacterium]|jgi:sugar (glycoside-pentoside-hexuronide) transporter|nr:MFS transporter [Propionibacteriaceae bacterium]
MSKATANFRTSTTERFAFVLFMSGQTIFNQFLNGYGQKFLTEAGLTAATIGTIFLATRIFDAVNDPIFGGIIDRAHLKGGKFLPWLRLSAVLLPILTVALFCLPATLPAGGKITWAATFYVLYSVAYTICDVPIFSMISATTDSVQERVHIMSRNALGAAVVTLLIAAVVPNLYPVIGWNWTAAIMAAAAAALMVPMGRLGRERYVNRDPEKVTLKAMLRYLRGNRYLQLYFAGLFLLFSTSTTSQAGLFFADFNLGDPGQMTVITLVLALPALLVVVGLPLLTRRLDKFRIFLVCVVGQIVVSVVSYVAGYANTPVFYALLAVRGVFWGGNAMMLGMFTSDFIEFGEFRTGKRLQGTAYSIQTFTSKVMTAVAGAIVMFWMARTGFVEGADTVQSPATLAAIWELIALFPAFGAALSLVFLLRYDLRDKDVQLMARANGGEISRAEAEAQFSHPYR